MPRDLRLKVCLLSCALAVSACGPSSASSPSRYGSITVDSVASTDAPIAPTAFFYRYTTGASGSCAVQNSVNTASGFCEVWSCDTVAYQTLPGIATFSAGTLSIEGAAQPLPMMDGGDGSYTINPFDSGTLWDGGELLTAHIGGSMDFPAADIALKAPLPLTLTAPVVADTGLVIDATQDLAVTWTSPVSDAVYVALSTINTATAPDGSSHDNIAPGLDCTFAASAGTDVIPKAILAAAPAPDGASTKYELDVLTYSRNTLRTGAAFIDFRASWIGLTANPTFK